MKLEFKKLGDIATYINGYAFKPTDWGQNGKAIIRIQNLNNDNAEFNYFSGDINEKYIVKKGDILISWSASIGVYEWNKEDALLNQHIFKVNFNKEEINKIYFKHMVSIALNKAIQFMHGSTMKHITKKYFDDIKIPVPSLEIQKNIADILDKAKSLASKRKEQIEELDLLVKSKFIEMFRGDKNFDYIKIENLVEVKSDIVDGPFGSNLKTIDYVDSGVRVIQINNIGESQFRNGNKRYITEEKFNSLIKHSVIPGDIVVAKMGEPIGRACIVPNWLEKAVIVADCMKIHPDLNVINAKYLEFLLNTEEVKVQFKKYSQGSTRVRLNLTMLRQIEVLYPPIELQNQFADFVKQVDKLKFEMEKSLKELEDNFNSLLQKAFKGELFN